MIKTILVTNHGLDSISRDMLGRLASRGDMRVIIAGPDEGSRGGVEMPAIKSKTDFAAAKALRRVIKIEGVDIAFAPSTSGLACLLWATMGTKTKVVGYRGTQAKVRRSDPTNYLALLNPRVSHVVCETPDIKEYLGPRIGERKLSALEKPFALEWVAEAMKEPKRPAGAGKGTLCLSFVGNTKGRPHKGLRPLLEAMRLLKGRDVHLTMVGDAEEADKEYASDLAVTFTGPSPEAVKYIAGSDLYVLSSTRDASPRTVREAQACGVPCVVSDIAGARDLIAEGVTGVLVPPADPEKLAEAIAALADDRRKLGEMAAACRPYVAQRFDPVAYADFFYRIFSGL